MRHETHHMTRLFQAHKDDNAILKPSVLCVRSALVNKLYCTDVYCEWVSCLHLATIFRNSFNETETMSSNSFDTVKFCHCEVEDEDAADGFLRCSL